MSSKKWKVLGKLQNSKTPKLKTGEIVDILLANRGIKTKKQKEEFFNPTQPEKIGLKELGINEKSIKKAIKRIKEAKKKKEKVIVFGDYDADGVCATAILWECLYELGIDALPYIPERFSEGYGLKAKSVKSLSESYKNLGLILTVDNGIVANAAAEKAKEIGVDLVITDHHQKGKKLPKAYSIVHTTEIGGAAIGWILAREIRKKLEFGNWKLKIRKGLDLCAIGTISDQLPLIGANRSFAKHGLIQLNKTKRLGLLALFEEAQVGKGSIGTYEVNFVIAPRINAMGRLTHAMDSLRLLCTKDASKAKRLSMKVGKINRQRQKIVEDVVGHASHVAERRSFEGVIILHHESYHEGVIGLAASKLVERYYRPAIVISKGRVYSKASARSISGFNIIEAIRKFDDLLVEGGGHPMAAGFTIETKKLAKFEKRLEAMSRKMLTEDLLEKTLKIDMKLTFEQINAKLAKKLYDFEPYGIGNRAPVFVTEDVAVVSARAVGRDYKHLKMTVSDGAKQFDTIAFGYGVLSARLSPGTNIDLAYNLEENTWNGNTNLQLKVKDIKFLN